MSDVVCKSTYQGMHCELPDDHYPESLHTWGEEIDDVGNTRSWHWFSEEADQR